MLCTYRSKVLIGHNSLINLFFTLKLLSVPKVFYEKVIRSSSRGDSFLKSSVFQTEILILVQVPCWCFYLWFPESESEQNKNEILATFR